ncbi:auxin-binding protein ABP19a-like [Spinacia oleracea]|uniref:Germin-like protein n=1 Tax=Spinacia oleracea TaxID=3562 RepID=A0ABM3R7B4_SPIOL|nr:auxin-binding protein ABP19a-like [Spinacia oleracea]
MIFRILSILSLLISLSSANIVFDYCVGDLSLPPGPTGYSCKDPTTVTVDDFVYSGLRDAGNTANIFKFGANTAYAPQFPGLNGMGISMVRADLGVGGVVPLHSHRVAELAILIEGTLIAGFVDTNNTAYYKTLTKGDMMIFPPTLFHFQANIGSTPALAYVSFASENPGNQIFTTGLFRNTLPSELIEKVTLLDLAQVQKLKKIFGGSN